MNLSRVRKQEVESGSQMSPLLEAAIAPSCLVLAIGG